MVRMRIKLLPRRRLHFNCFIHHSVSGIKSTLFRKKVDNFVPSPNTWWRGKSYAASVASDITGPEKHRKRVPVEARRAMVESFVDKYKASNAGKLPSISDTRKQVGGSYYVVRKIFQELQNESTMSSLKSRSKKPIQEMAIKENPNVGGKHLEAASDWQKSSCAENLSADDNVKLATPVSDSVHPMRSHHLEDSEEVISSSHKKPNDDDKDLDVSEHFYTESHVLKKEQDVVSDVHLESRSSSEELKHEGPNYKEQKVHSSLEPNRENIDNRTVDKALLPISESKPWGRRIKSIVDGIMNMWRKL